MASPETENWATNFKSERTLFLLWLCRDVTSSITKQILDPPRPDIWTIKFHPILNRLQITEDTFANIFTFQLWLLKSFFGLSHPCNLHQSEFVIIFLIEVFEGILLSIIRFPYSCNHYLWYQIYQKLLNLRMFCTYSLNFSLVSLHKLCLHTLAFDHVRMYFYVVNRAFFWPPLKANVICEDLA